MDDNYSAPENFIWLSWFIWPWSGNPLARSCFTPCGAQYAHPGSSSTGKLTGPILLFFTAAVVLAELYCSPHLSLILANSVTWRGMLGRYWTRWRTRCARWDMFSLGLLNHKIIFACRWTQTQWRWQAGARIGVEEEIGQILDPVWILLGRHISPGIGKADSQVALPNLEDQLDLEALLVMMDFKVGLVDQQQEGSDKQLNCLLFVISQSFIPVQTLLDIYRRSPCLKFWRMW